jgi:phosphoribosylformimino-5-aminoimidazole carboxamide ribotide isomerase
MRMTPNQMHIIPAIDLKGGKCVRLRQGKDDATTEYSADPVGTAREWFAQGAHRLHLVNLDGAFGRASGHLEVLRGIAALHLAPVQYGGGLRSVDAVEEAFEAGAAKVVLGTVAVENPPLFKEIMRGRETDQIIVAVDAVKGYVATRGWTSVSSVPAIELVRRLLDDGVREVLYTDVARDGMLTGPDLSTLEQLAATGMKVIASGGIASAGDVEALLALNNQNISGLIIGMALYERRVSLPDLVSLVTSPERRQTN